MRFLLFALMIVLLPLRGWVGDAMATEMALAQLQHPSSATKNIAVDTHETRAETHFHHEIAMPDRVHELQAANHTHEAQAIDDCAGHAPDDASSHLTDGHCGACAACQACHTVGLSSSTADLNLVVNSPTLPHSLAAQFASAEAALGQKPPIS
ncbi:hypothetical protein [Polaromonas jejuensis]|uniref:Uncharacterized protein n=1 Tax=Polaromonas jejuensis TaxID=457502 RepID=A0ABW0Q4S6_9BURK|nr:hypothetical protein [Polaromonas jejuensis]